MAGAKISCSSQGAAEVNLAYWSHGDQFAGSDGALLIHRPAGSSNMPTEN
nr:hypothetical protein [Rhizobium grahamii]